MIYIKPDFYDDFECVDSRCNDNCCIGWEIDVDDDAFERYCSLGTGFSKKIINNITTDAELSRCFKLTDDERCPFLNDDNLCDIIINCGKEYLCDICREHPRFYEWFPGVTECGLGLSCPEACRLLLADGKPLRFIEFNDKKEITLNSKKEIAESDMYVYLSAFREKLFDILATDGAFEDKMARVLSQTENFTDCKIKISNYKNMLLKYEKTEPIDEKWTLYISELIKNADEICACEEKFDSIYDCSSFYSKIFAYLLYRHLIKAVFDASVNERVRFCAEAVRFIKFCDMYSYLKNGELQLCDRIENLKNWSKQVEYSEENTEMLITDI